MSKYEHVISKRNRSCEEHASEEYNTCKMESTNVIQDCITNSEQLFSNVIHTSTATHCNDSRDDATIYEKEHVRDVYNSIAPHFSATRYKAWPRIQQFLETLPSHVMIADVGCGNGKYFASCQRKREQEHSLCNTTNSSSKIVAVENCAFKTQSVKRYVVGLDVSENLLRLTQRAIADPNYDPMSKCPENDGNESTGMNYSHNNKSNEKAKHSLLHEQNNINKHHNNNAIVSDSNVECANSNIVKERWHEPLPRTDVICADGIHCPLQSELFDVVICIAVVHHYSTYQRRKAAVQELLRLVRSHGGLVLIYVWAFEGVKMEKCALVTSDQIHNVKEHNNDNVANNESVNNNNNTKDSNTANNEAKLTHRMRVNVESGDAMVRWETHAKFDPNQPIYHRYYHLFKQGELEELCQVAARDCDIAVSIKNAYYDKENWCILLERLERIENAVQFELHNIKRLV